jgi:ATP synthase protein I
MGLLKGQLTDMNEPKSQKNADPKLNDLADRLKDLGGRIAAEQSDQAKASKPHEGYKSARNYSKGYRLASEFVAGVLVGGLVGYGVDYLLGTIPLFLIMFLLFGFGAGILNMARAAKQDQPSPEELQKMMPPKSAYDEEED